MSEVFYFNYDEDGYYTGVTAVQEGSEQPQNSTDVEPKIETGFWYKFSTDDKEWTSEKIPETAEDCVGITFPFEDPDINSGSTTDKSTLTSHQVLLRSIVTRILSDSEDVRVENTDGVCTVVAIDADTKLKEAKEAKETELTGSAHRFDNDLVCEDMIITSSLGFNANADIRSQNNVRGLLNILADEATTAYADADNSYHMLTKAQLETLLNEIITNGNNLYAQKWAYRTKIEACTTVEEVQAITFEFTMTDFSKS